MTSTATMTSTTLLLSPAAFFAGTWQILVTGGGSSPTSPCGSLPTQITDTLTVAVNPAVRGAASGSLASLPHVLFTGGVLETSNSDDGALQLTAELTNTQGCLVIEALTLRPSSPLDTEGFDEISVMCPGQATCLVQYSGSFRRSAL
jgi:hypothetical protein